MKKVYLLLLIAVLAAGCASEKHLPARQSTDLDSYAEKAFAQIYGINGVNSMIYSFYDVQAVEGLRDIGRSFTINFRIRGANSDYQARWSNFSTTQTNSTDVYPFQVQATCTSSDCYRIAVLISYQEQRGQQPLYSAITLQVSPQDQYYYKVIHSSPVGTQSYAD